MVMKDDFEVRLLLTTVAEADVELSQWIQRLVSDRDLELGDDPRLVNDMERDLQLITRCVCQLGPQFDLSRVSLREANDYFSVTRQLDEVVALVGEIRERAYGSRHNTRQCLDKIIACLASVRQIGNQISTTALPMQ